MGSYLFKWYIQPALPAYPGANNIYVTGAFDDCGKTYKLKRVGRCWEKQIGIVDADRENCYKLVVNDSWTTDRHAPYEDVGNSNLQNVLLPDIIQKNHTPDKPFLRLAGGKVGAQEMKTYMRDVYLPQGLSEQLCEDEGVEIEALIMAAGCLTSAYSVRFLGPYGPCSGHEGFERKYVHRVQGPKTLFVNTIAADHRRGPRTMKDERKDLKMASQPYSYISSSQKTSLGTARVSRAR